MFIIPGGFSCYRVLMSFVKPGSPHFQGVINIGMSPIPDWKMARRVKSEELIVLFFFEL